MKETQSNATSHQGDQRDFEQRALRPDELVFNEDGLIPAIVQDSSDGTVLMMAYMDREALDRTLTQRKAWFFSRSRQTYWLKGESSKNVLKVCEIRYDCDADTLLLRVGVEGQGVACHTGRRSCFYRTLFSEEK